MKQSKPSSRWALQFGLLITALGGFLFTFDIPLLRLAGAEKWTMVFARGLMLFWAISVVWCLARISGRSRQAYIAGWAGWAVIATNTLANIAFIGAVSEAHAANVVFILALVPVLTAVFSRIFINEPVHPYTWLATVLALSGVAFIGWDGLHSGKFLGDALAFVCACCTAAAFTIIRASGKNVATSLALGSLISAAIAWGWFGVDFTALFAPASYGMPAWFWIALNGLVAIPLASSLIANGPRYLPSVDVSMFFLLETLLTPVWIWLLFGERPTDRVLIGGGIVVVTLVVHSVWRLNEGIAGAKQAPAYHE